MKVFDPVSQKFPHLLHGGDYNPDQWQDRPDILEEDIRLMKLAGCNAMSVGIFAWTSLEPEDGVYTFEWLDQVMDRMYENGIMTVLATPSGARPAWLSQTYPEVLRVGANRVRNLHGQRHNHCYTSPAYRRKIESMNDRLATRYAAHPGLILWHISNEYGGDCHCPLCQDAFREWLQVRYNHDLDKLNHAWWTPFWSHQYTDWSQIESPSPIGEQSVHGLQLDWHRFVSAQTADFIRHEIRPLREHTPHVPVTINMMGTYDGLDYFKLAKDLDLVSWDSYPNWHNDRMTTAELASDTAFVHDLNRSLCGGKPFLLMESTPSNVNWHPVNKLKRPGMHLLSSVQAIAHGSDSVQYFQWRKSRGAAEKFHGAVVDHVGTEQTRVFQDVAKVGEVLSKLGSLPGSTIDAQVAVIYDWENRWVIDSCQALRPDKKLYEDTCKAHYRSFWKQNVAVDIIDSECDFSPYRIVVAPMLHMLKPGVADRITAFVDAGGTFVATYFTGEVDESDLTFLGGFPGPLRPVLGIWAEEIDSLYDTDHNSIEPVPGNVLGMNVGQEGYGIHHFCERIHAETAEVVGTYTSDFYQGEPALTRNAYGHGEAWYIAARTGQDFLDEFYGRLLTHSGVEGILKSCLPVGVSATRRTGLTGNHLFIMNFNEHPVTLTLQDSTFLDALTGEEVAGTILLPVYGVRILKD